MSNVHEDFDPKCLELAEYFLAEGFMESELTTENRNKIARHLAVEIQEAVEAFFEATSP